MPLTDMAYWPGDDDNPAGDRPRCPDTPTKADTAANAAMRRGRWECALWAGHGDSSSARHQGHAWVRTGEDD